MHVQGSFEPSHGAFVKLVFVFFVSMLVSITSVFPSETSFISYLNLSYPELTYNPASIAVMEGFNYDSDIPIAYSSKDASRHETYYDDLYDGVYDVQFEKENTIMLNGKLAIHNFGLTFKKQTSLFEKDTKNTSQYLNIKEEYYDEVSAGVVVGKKFGSLLLGMKQERVMMNSKVKTTLSNDTIYKTEYYKPTYGFMFPIAFFSLSAFHQPEVKTKIIREHITGKKEMVYTVPSKTVYGTQLIISTANTVSYFAFDSGKMESTDINKPNKDMSEEQNIIRGGLASFNFGKNYGMTFGQREYPVGTLKIKKRFMSVKLYILGVLKIGYNQFLMTDKTGKTSEFKYPEVSFKFQVDIKDDDKKETTEKEECEDPWKGNVVTSCE